MSPFLRGKFYSLYVPRESGGVVQRACGTTDVKLARAMGRMVDVLADGRRWEILRALDERTVTLGEAYDAFVANDLDGLLARKARAAEPAVSTFLDAWLKTLHNAPRTKASYEQKVRHLITEGLTLSHLTRGWVADRLATLPHRAPTVRQYAHALSLFCQYLMDHDRIPQNPVARVRLPKGKSKRTVWKSADDDLRLVNAAPSPFREYFALVHASGAERDAALAMLRSDLDLEAGECHIPGTKTATRDRRGVPIDAWALPILRRYVKGMLPGAKLFPTLTSKMVNTEHVAARTAAKLPDYQLRDARHSFAVRHILAGRPIWLVSKWLGHSNIAITAAVYADFGLEAALAELNRHTTPRATSRGGR